MLQVLIPVLAQSHYVTYILNLKKNRFEYLTSLKGYSRASTSFGPIGNILMGEACHYIYERYDEQASVCPYIWDDFEWHDIDVPIQPDKASCGVFTMAFLKEWDGDVNEIKCFQNWQKKKKDEKVSVTNRLRIELCCSIVKDKTNIVRESMQAEANEFCQQLKTSLFAKEGGDGRGKKRKM